MVIVANVLGYTVDRSVQSMVSNAADADSQGQTHGRGQLAEQPDRGGRAPDRRAAAGVVSHLPPGDWRIGAPLYLLRRVAGAALSLAWIHFAPARSLAATSPRPAA